MPRSRRIRNYIQEISASPNIEKASFIPPFMVLIVEIILLAHAFSLKETYVIFLTTILLALSIVEIILVSREIHDHYKKSNFDKVLTIQLDDFVTKRKTKNVKELVESFIKKNPQYAVNRNEIYRTVCQIMQIHKK